MTLLHVLAATILLLVCWGALQALGQQLGNADSHCSMNDKCKLPSDFTIENPTLLNDGRFFKSENILKSFKS